MTIAQTFLARDAEIREMVNLGVPIIGGLNERTQKVFEDICKAEVYRKIILEDGAGYTLTIPAASQKLIELVDYEDEHYREVYFDDGSFLTLSTGMILAKNELGQLLKPPASAQVVAARKVAELTQTQAAQVVHVTLRTWQSWEIEQGVSYRQMPLGAWELFLIKTDQLSC